jgi:hypothetical protein
MAFAGLSRKIQDNLGHASWLVCRIGRRGAVGFIRAGLRVTNMRNQ